MALYIILVHSGTFCGTAFIAETALRLQDHWQNSLFKHIFSLEKVLVCRLVGLWRSLNIRLFRAGYMLTLED